MLQRYWSTRRPLTSPDARRAIHLPGFVASTCFTTFSKQRRAQRAGVAASQRACWEACGGEGEGERGREKGERWRLQVQQALAIQPPTPQVEAKEPSVHPSACSSLQESKHAEYSTGDQSTPEANSRKSMPRCCGCRLAYESVGPTKEKGKKIQHLGKKNNYIKKMRYC